MIRLLDTVVLDMIPNPEYLALANSLAFSIAVSPHTHCSFAYVLGCGKGGRTIHGQLRLFDIYSCRFALLNRQTCRLGVFRRDLYPQSSACGQIEQGQGGDRGGLGGRKTRLSIASDVDYDQKSSMSSQRIDGKRDIEDSRQHSLGL